MRRKRKARVQLNHEQKRQVAKQVLAGRYIKQIAADFNISDDYARKTANEYLVTFRQEKFPDPA